nr:basic proline-rich protein-like [Kogia breviceps]
MTPGSSPGPPPKGPSRPFLRTPPASPCRLRPGRALRSPADHAPSRPPRTHSRKLPPALVSLWGETLGEPRDRRCGSRSLAEWTRGDGVGPARSRPQPRPPQPAPPTASAPPHPDCCGPSVGPRARRNSGKVSARLFRPSGSTDGAGPASGSHPFSECAFRLAAGEVRKRARGGARAFQLARAAFRQRRRQALLWAAAGAELVEEIRGLLGLALPVGCWDWVAGRLWPGGGGGGGGTPRCGAP